MNFSKHAIIAYLSAGMASTILRHAKPFREGRDHPLVTLAISTLYPSRMQVHIYLNVQVSSSNGFQCHQVALKVLPQNHYYPGGDNDALARRRGAGAG